MLLSFFSSCRNEERHWWLLSEKLFTFNKFGLCACHTCWSDSSVDYRVLRENQWCCAVLVLIPCVPLQLLHHHLLHHQLLHHQLLHRHLIWELGRFTLQNVPFRSNSSTSGTGFLVIRFWTKNSLVACILSAVKFGFFQWLSNSVFFQVACLLCRGFISVAEGDRARCVKSTKSSGSGEVCCLKLANSWHV